MLSSNVKEDGIGYFEPDKQQRTLDFINDFLLEEPLELDEAFIADPIVNQGDVLIANFEDALDDLDPVLGRPNPLTADLGY